MTNSSRSPQSTASSMSTLEPLLAPRSVAVVGASATPGKLGPSVLRNLVHGGFDGKMYAVNSGGTAVEDQPGHRSLAGIGSPIDCAFLAIPVVAIEQAVADCAKAGVRSVIVGASGFAELGTPEGVRRQQAIATIARNAGMRMLGPNTNGLLNVPGRVSLGYNASHSETFSAGAVSIVSHSGALFDGIAKLSRRTGVYVNVGQVSNSATGAVTLGGFASGVPIGARARTLATGVRHNFKYH